MIEFHTFRNSDPPELLRLWQTCGLGRGAACDFDVDVLESVVFSQPYFDPAGLIFAVDGEKKVGFVHAGFGPDEAQSGVDYRHGTICAVMVDPSYRRQGIGRELIRRAEAYLASRGTSTGQAGPAAPLDPFYFGIYGGSRPAGFLRSDPLADPFFRSLGYVPVSEYLIFQRQLEDRSSPGGLRLMNVRRATKLGTPDPETRRSWWWSTRPGRLDSLELALLPKSGGKPLANVTVIGLDFYIPRWQQRGIGIMDLMVPEEHRRKGYGQALLVEVCRRVREEMISVVEAHAQADDSTTIRVLTSAGFSQIDSGLVYQKSLT